MLASPGASSGARALSAGWQLALCGLGWLLGLALQLQQPALPPAPVHASLALASIAALWAAWRWPVLRGAGVPMLACAALAFALTGLRAQARLDERLMPALEGVDLQVTGVVATLPQVGPSGTRFVFEVEQATLRGAPVALPPRLALGWYRHDGDDDELDTPGDELRAGQRWRLPLRLKQPHGTLNPAGFDVELMWFEQGVGATGHVRVTRQGPAPQRLAEAVAHPVQRLRQAVRGAIERQVPEPRPAGVLAALAVGDQAAIEREDWELFRTTGIAHLVSISGVHVTMFAWLAGVLAGTAWRRSARLMLWLPAPLAARWIGLALAAAYALLAGWGVPAQRTVVMLGVTVALRSLGQPWPWGLVLLAAAVTVTAIDPWALLQPGFWLSFVAVGLLMASEPASRGAVAAPGWRTLLHGQLRAQAVATLGLAPLSLVFFQQLSLVGVLANLLAIPWVTLVITPLALLGMALPALWGLAALAVQAMVGVLGWLAHWPAAVWTAPVAPPWMQACGLLGAVLAVLPLPWRLRVLALPLVLPLLWPPVARPAPGRFELLAADVGQGTAVLVRTRQHLLVYDAGPQYSRESDAGLRVLLPLLRSRGEARVDLLMLSHRDTDHVGGAASLLAGTPVAALRSSLAADHPLLAGARPHQACQAGQRWQWDGVQFEVLHPRAEEAGTGRKPNTLSCVLRVADDQGRSALLTGDIESAQELALVQRAGTALASTVLLVPHHGSRTSSSEAFIEAVQPQVAVVQAGYRSRYGHPVAEVLSRYRDRGIEVVRSDHCGAWLWHDGAAACTRDVRRRYWHWGPAVGGANVAADRPPGADPR